MAIEAVSTGAGAPRWGEGWGSAPQWDAVSSPLQGVARGTDVVCASERVDWRPGAVWDGGRTGSGQEVGQGLPGGQCAARRWVRGLPRLLLISETSVGAFWETFPWIRDSGLLVVFSHFF